MIIVFLKLIMFYVWCFQSRLLQSCCMEDKVNPFPHIDAFWRLCSRRLFKNIVTKEEIAHKRAIPPFDTMFSTFSHRLSIQLEIYYFWTKYVQSRLLQNCCMRERVKPYVAGDVRTTNGFKICGRLNCPCKFKLEILSAKLTEEYPPLPCQSIGYL